MILERNIKLRVLSGRPNEGAMCRWRLWELLLQLSEKILSDYAEKEGIQMCQLMAFKEEVWQKREINRI